MPKHFLCYSCKTERINYSGTFHSCPECFSKNFFQKTATETLKTPHKENNTNPALYVTFVIDYTPHTMKLRNVSMSSDPTGVMSIEEAKKALLETTRKTHPKITRLPSSPTPLITEPGPHCQNCPSLQHCKEGQKYTQKDYTQ